MSKVLFDMMPAKTDAEKKAIIHCDKCGLTWQYGLAQENGWKAVLRDPFSFRCKVCLPKSLEINQCDGCRRGLPIVDGLHKGPGYDMIACTKGRY